jgi:CRISPR-associated endonuclease/helicase Cas3
LHDLSKAESEFQKRVQTDDKEGERQPHAHHGAVYALLQEPAVWPVALAINGHHAGLHNRGDVAAKRARYGPLALACLERLSQASPAWSTPVFSAHLPDWLSGLTFDVRNSSEGWFAVKMFTRFLFSALIDADRLDTEKQASATDTSARRPPRGPSAKVAGTLRRAVALGE